MKSHDLYKIGKAKNVNKRIQTFKTGNPVIEVVKVIEGDYEHKLHKIYKEKRVIGEWFSLSSKDVENISVLYVTNYIEEKETVVNPQYIHDLEYLKNYTYEEKLSQLEAAKIDVKYGLVDRKEGLSLIEQLKFVLEVECPHC